MNFKLELTSNDLCMFIRLSKTMLIELLEMIQHGLCQNTHLNMSLSPILQLLISLRYYATNAFQVHIYDCYAYTQKHFKLLYIIYKNIYIKF